jgi:Ca2+-transporting ATPase
MPQPSTPPPCAADPAGHHSGLSATEAARRLQAEGPNELTPSQQRRLGAILAEVAREPMFQLLAAAGALYLLLGDVGEAAMLLAFVCLTVAITVWQGLRTERALEALRDLTSPRALVLRGGQRLRIAGREVVRGDLLVLSEGDRIAADARLLVANDLRADESLLTGEALPVSKLAAAPKAAGDPSSPARPGCPDTAARPGGDGQTHVYAGTLVVGGQGLARVLATGPATEIGRIGQALGTMDSPATPLNLQTRHLVRVFSVIGLMLSVVVVGLYGTLRGDWIAGLLAGITLAMSMLPQEFLLILTVFMAMGAWRLSRQRVLTRRPATIEALGAATVLCTDKTGTLTQNRMTVMALAVPAGSDLTPWATWATWAAGDAALPAAFHTLLESGLLASERDPFDTMDQAFARIAAEQLPASHRHPDWDLVQDYGLVPTLLAMTHVWQVPGDAVHRVAVKGAQEAVLGLCRLPEAGSLAINAAGQAMACRGLRVLAVARGRFEPEAAAYPATPQGFELEFLGLVGLADPLRGGVIEAVQDCRNAGIRVVMITGDHPATARAMATQAGLDSAGATLTGAELATLDEAALRRRVAGTTVYARVLPEQKLRIVQALQASGEVVAMTGDGVNDAPSLKAAHIGIAMGGRGTDVAREAASLVLLDDDFGSIVGAVRLGRRIYDNLRKAMAFVFAVHVPIAGLSLMPLLFGLPLVFTPVHIAFLELLIDPVCSIVFESEPEEGSNMQRPPRDPATPLFSRALIANSLAQGGLVLLAVGLFFVALLHSGVAEAAARGATFSALVGCSVALILVNRSLSGRLWSSLLRPNPALWRVLAATAALLTAVLLIAPLRALFRFAAPTPGLMGAAGALVLLVLLALQALLWLLRRPRLSR